MNALKNTAKSTEELWLANHDSIDLLKNILIENKWWYIPWHVLHSSWNVWEYLNQWLTKETHQTIWYSIALEVLEILYQPDRDVLSIKYNWEWDKNNSNITLAVWQANMILQITQNDFSWRISTLLDANSENDIIIIEGGSGLVG